jgi:hypothetical protein
MFCSRCGHENADEARFCAECGAPQQEEGQELGAYRPLEDAEESEDADGAPGPSDIPPRALGELISESLTTYGKAFLPLFVIALIPQIPTILGAALGSGDSFDDSTSVSFSSADLVLPLIAFLLSIPSGAAAVFCVGQVLTGRKADIVTCYSRAFGVLLPTAVVTVIVTVALVASAILMLILIGIPLFFYLLVIWFFALPAVVIEGRDGISALKRSRELTLGSWWRLFGIGVVFTLLAIAAAIPVGIVLVIVSLASVNVVEVGLGVIAALLIPFFYAGSVLVYVDLRVRQEGYGTQELADDLSRRPGRMAP